MLFSFVWPINTEVCYQFSSYKRANKKLWINPKYCQSVFIIAAELFEVFKGFCEMASKCVFKVFILLSFVMSSFCYVYIIPGEIVRSKGWITDELWLSLSQKTNLIFFHSSRSCWSLLLQRYAVFDKTRWICFTQDLWRSFLRRRLLNDDYGVRRIYDFHVIVWRCFVMHRIFSCGTFSLQDPNCKKWERDYTQIYPKCCNTFICVEFTKDGVASKEIVENSLE